MPSDLAYTFRVDLSEVVTQEVVLDMLRESGVGRCIMYYEEGDKTSKPHLQGWIEFADERERYQFTKSKVKNFRAKYNYVGNCMSCAAVKKDSYFAYTSKDKKCVYSVGVTDVERKANEDRSYKKGSKKESALDVVYYEMAGQFERTGHLSKTDVCEAIIRTYREASKPMYAATIKAQTLMIWAKVRGSVADRLLANEFFSN